MAHLRTASPPSPPEDWLERLRDYAQVRNLLNGDTVLLVNDPTLPVAERLYAFFSDPFVSEAWEKFNQGRPRL